MEGRVLGDEVVSVGGEGPSRSWSAVPTGCGGQGRSSFGDGSQISGLNDW